MVFREHQMGLPNTPFPPGKIKQASNHILAYSDKVIFENVHILLTRA